MIQEQARSPSSPGRWEEEPAEFQGVPTGRPDFFLLGVSSGGYKMASLRMAALKSFLMSFLQIGF